MNGSQSSVAEPGGNNHQGDWKKRQADAIELVRLGMVEFNELLRSVRKDRIRVKLNGGDLVAITSIDRLTEDETVKAHR